MIHCNNTITKTIPTNSTNCFQTNTKSKQCWHFHYPSRPSTKIEQTKPPEIIWLRNSFISKTNEIWSFVKFRIKFDICKDLHNRFLLIHLINVWIFLATIKKKMLWKWKSSIGQMNCTENGSIFPLFYFCLVSGTENHYIYFH